MHSTLPFILVAIAVLGLLGILLWGGRQAKSAPAAPVATRNHKSVRSFNYGPTSVAAPTPPTTAPAPVATNVLEHFMPAEDLRAKEQAQAEAARLEAEQQAVVAPAPAATVDKVVAADEVAAAPAPTAPVSALDMLGTDELPTTPSSAPGDSSDEVVPDPALFYNPFSAAAPTANDEANQLAAVELRQRQRAAMKAKSAGQIAALSTLYKKD